MPLGLNPIGRAGFGYMYGSYNHPDLWSVFSLFTFHTMDHRTQCPSCTSHEEPNSSSRLLHQIVEKSRRGIEPRTPHFNSKPDMPIGLSLIGRAVSGWFWLYLTEATIITLIFRMCPRACHFTPQTATHGVPKIPHARNCTPCPADYTSL